MSETTCPEGTLISLHLDNELEPATEFAVSAHLSACSRCRSVADQLRQVDELLRRPPACELARVDLSRLLTERRSPLRRVAALVLGLLVLAAVAAGGTYAGRQLAEVFRTDHNVETWPTDRLPPTPPGAQSLNPEFRPGAEPIPDIRPVAEVEASLGTRLLEPTFIPGGYELLVRYSPLKMHAELQYLRSGPAWTTISIRESNHPYGIVERPPVPPGAAETVYVNGRRAIYVRGGWSSDTADSEPYWDPDLVHSLTFDVGVLVIEISAPPSVSRDDLMQMASSVR